MPFLVLYSDLFHRLPITSVDDKQHSSEVMFSDLVGFSLLERYPTFRLGAGTGIPGALET